MKSADVPRAAGDTIASAEVSLYRNVLGIRDKHGLEDLAISFFDYETTIQWSYNGDSLMHAASTMKLAVLLGVFRQIARGELSLESPVHVRNRFTSIVNREPFMLDLDRESDPDVYGYVGQSMSIHKLAHAMITTSNNLATNLLVDIIGVSTIQQSLDELEIDGVKVLRGVEDQAAFEAGLNNEVTSNGLVKLLRVIADGNPARPAPRAARPAYARRMKDQSGSLLARADEPFERRSKTQGTLPGTERRRNPQRRKHDYSIPFPDRRLARSAYEMVFLKLVPEGSCASAGRRTHRWE